MVNKTSLINTIFFISVAVFTLVSCKTKVPNLAYSPESLSDFLRYEKNKPAKISVHRGGGDKSGYPENCLESFQHFYGLMPVIIECDIELTKDSVLVLMHDNKLDRTSTGLGLVSSYNYADLSNIRLKDNFGKVTSYKIPTLKDVLVWGKGKVVFTLDVKKHTPYKKVCELVDELNAENYAAIITYNFNQVKEVYDINKELMISASIMKNEDYERLNAAGIPDRNLIAFIGTREPKKEFIDYLHEKGISCILGVLGNLDKKAASNNNKNYLDWLNLGVDVFATDRPEAVNEVLKLTKNK